MPLVDSYHLGLYPPVKVHSPHRSHSLGRPGPQWWFVCECLSKAVGSCEFLEQQCGRLPRRARHLPVTRVAGHLSSGKAGPPQVSLTASLVWPLVPQEPEKANAGVAGDFLPGSIRTYGLPCCRVYKELFSFLKFQLIQTRTVIHFPQTALPAADCSGRCA